ncbi:MAG: VCBS repeat-containing protein [Planctomycetota bacterium]
MTTKHLPNRPLLIFPILCLGFLIAATGCDPVSPSVRRKQGKEGDIKSASKEESARIEIIKKVTQSEELVGNLAGGLSQIAATFEDPSAARDSVFQETVKYVGPEDFDLESLVEKSLAHSDHVTTHKFGVMDSARDLKPADERIWSKVVGSDEKFDSCNFGVTGAQFDGEDFLMETLFEGRLTDSKDRIIGVKAHQELRWTKVENDWKLAAWTQQDFKLLINSGPLFVDVTDRVIPDKETLERARTYSHWELMLKQASVNTPTLRHTRIQYKYFNDWESSYTFPCVSVVDWNRDGHDDLFVTDRWQPSQLLQNNGDGTFTDVSIESGLYIEEMAISSIFADFDNDGDEDVIIGGAVNGSRYFEMVDGKYVEDTTAPQWKDMKYVTSGSVVDINNDGLLDVYLATSGLGEGPFSKWGPMVVRPQETEKFKEAMHKSHHFMSRGGLPNIVLMNYNGKLYRVENLCDELSQYRATLQSAWSDFDSDGDLDLYVSNDFAPDAFLRNDTPQGASIPVFTDFSDEIVPAKRMGFGMGTSFGDYNNDGLLDLYVTNMYSKAGTRILKQFPDASDQIKSAAYGNFLYENVGGKFKQVAGTTEGTQQVSKVGWAFGGQFADFDNDTHLDIYVPSGFFTPPEALRKPGDW